MEQTIEKLRDSRTKKAVALFIIFLVLFWTVIFPWEKSLSQGVYQWLGAALIVALIFVSVVIITFVQDPNPFYRAISEWKANRLRNAGKKVPERHLSEENIAGIKRKYPGLF